MRSGGAWAVMVISLAAAGCGYVGDPLPPALNIPERVVDLRAVQRGDRLIVVGTVSPMTTDKLVMKGLPPVELYAGRRGEGEFSTERWAHGAEVVTQEPGAEAEVVVELPVAKWVEGEVVLGVRTVGPTGKRSAWSNLVSVWVVKELGRPEGLRGSATEAGVFLQWEAGEGPEGRSWRVYRKGPEGEEFALLGKAGEASWLDRGIEYGRRYSYFVQAVAAAGDGEAESEPGRVLTVEPRDTFPPAVPAGLTVIAGVNTIELAWERNAEADFAAYQIWRSEGEGEFTRVGDPVSVLSFSDTGLVSGRRYKYALTAIDQAGNESAKCEAVEITAP